jgi:SAM-dependent methyltransferase
MNALQELQRNWEGLAQADPLWAICTDPEARNNQWDQEKFFATGKKELEMVLDCVRRLGLNLPQNASALDFGCGVGRLTRAMAAQFPECWGVDISPTMVRLAQEFNREISHCRFIVNASDRLERFQDNQFGFTYSSIVLQHIAKKYASKYIAELVRILRHDGVLVFQAPEKLQGTLVKRFRGKLALRSRVQSFFGHKPFRMEMHCLEEVKIRELVRQCGAQVMDVRLTNSADPAFCGDLRYLAEELQSGYISKQYCVVKR